MGGRRLALVIGNNYPNSGKELKFAVADATKIKEVLENKDIFSFDEITYLENKTSREASSAIEKILKNKDSDFVFIYFSGHGRKDFENDLCLLFKDTEEDDLFTTSLTFDFINKCIRFPSRKSVVIVLDCCYSCLAEIRDTDFDVMEYLEVPSGSGTIILTSTGSTGSPKAREDKKLGHGVFTYYLIEGLETGNADKNCDGYISIDEWYNYASDKTKESCSQSPMKKGSIEGNIFIGKNPKIIEEKEYELKKEKLLDEFGDQLPSDILGECQAILRKRYKNPSILKKEDKIILNYIESLLQDNLLSEKQNDAIQNCIEAVQHQKKKEQQEKSREKQRKREDKEALERKQKEEEERKRKKEEEKVRKEAEEKAIKEKEEQEILYQQQEEFQKQREETEQKQRDEERKREVLEGKKLENPRDTREIKKEVSVSSGKIQVKEKAGSYLKYAKIFWSVLVVVLALVAAVYVGSYGNHATPVPATPISLASFDANTTSGHAPLDVQFTTLSKNATLVNWDFGDGNTSIEKNPKHTYFTPGRYIVNLTASNGNITNSTLTTISVSAEPFAYILGDTVSVVDIATDKVVGTIDVPFNPEVVAVTPDGSKIYMAKQGNISAGHDSDISVIDTATNTITANVFVGSYPWGIAVTPDGTKVYLTISNDYSNPFPNTVSVIDTATDTVVSKVNVGSQPCDVAVTPDGKKAYVTDWNNTVSVIDTATNTITDTLNIDSAPDENLFKIKISPDGKKAYLINDCGDTVSIIDTTTNTITATVTAGRSLSGVITPDGTKVYVASYLDNNVSVIDTATNTVTATMNLGMGPFAIAVTPDGKKVYVANRYSNDVSVIDTATNKVTATVSVGEEPCDVSIAPDGKKVYVPNYNDGTFSVIDTSTDTVTTTVPLGQNPDAAIIK